MNDIVQATFDYGVLDNETQIFLKVKAESIRARLKRTAEDIIAIGQDLIEAKAKLREENENKRGLFLPWINREFGMSERTARNFMQVCDRFGGKLPANFADISISILYELATPSTNDSTIEKVLSGEINPTIEAIKHEKEAEKKRADEAERAKREQDRIAAY